MSNKKVKFWDWTDDGQEVLFTGFIMDAFLDPDERFSRWSYRVMLDEGCCEYPGECRTPYMDECRELVTDDELDQ